MWFFKYFLLVCGLSFHSLTSSFQRKHFKFQHVHECLHQHNLQFPQIDITQIYLNEWWINKLWYIYTEQFYSSVKMIEVLLYTTWTSKGLLGKKKKISLKGYISYDSINMTTWKNIGIGNKSVVTRGNVREEGLIKRVNNKELPNMLQLWYNW